ncbi:MAG TPA: prepilin-type N-terminal cleavage/methylation domain-containing protein [Polyangia bacterium]
MVSARRRRPRGGFTIIELIIAMALTTVGLVGLVALQSIAIRGNMMSRNFGEAIGIAQQRLELAERTPYPTLAALTPADPACATSGNPCANGTAKVNPNPDSNNTTQALYTRCTTVTDNGDNTTTVLARVCWQDTSSAWHHVDLRTRRSP